MCETRSEVLAWSKRKAIAAGVTTAAAVTLGVVGWPVTAALTAVPAVLLGGFVPLLVVAMIAWRVPELRRLEHIG